MTVAIHGEDEVFVVACEMDGAGEDGVGEIGPVGVTEVDACRNLIEPIGLVDGCFHNLLRIGSQDLDIPQTHVHNRVNRYFGIIHRCENGLQGCCMVYDSILAQKWSMRAQQKPIAGVWFDIGRREMLGCPHWNERNA